MKVYNFTVPDLLNSDLIMIVNTILYYYIDYDDYDYVYDYDKVYDNYYDCDYIMIWLWLQYYMYDVMTVVILWYVTIK